MREIKFRVWNPVDKSMSDNLDLFYMTDCRDYDTYGSYYERDVLFLQYTGLKDKNGKEIYDGDICPNYGGVQIIWRQDKSRYDFQYKHPSFGSPQWIGGIDEHFAKTELVVIGNIYENPELLEVANNG